MFHKEGFQIIIIALFATIGLSVLANSFVVNPALRYSILFGLLLILVLILQFFRNPKRDFLLDPDKVLSPVDGKVVVIEEVFEKEYFNEKRLQVSVFMSPINVHVTRYPVGGTIAYSKYHPGKYLVAWHPKASEENERTTVVIDNPVFGEVMYRQIAGALAKRIVNYAKVGNRVIQGEDAGFIKFGSRVDLYLPVGTDVNVVLNQKAKGNKTVIAHK